MQKYIIKLGGSLVIPSSGINISYLRDFNDCIRRHVSQGKHIYIVVGGGKTTRDYQEAAQAIIKEIPTEDVDWLGIHSTRLNAQLLRTIFKDIAHPRVIENYDHILEDQDKPVVVASGWKPGHSTNMCAVKLSIDYDIETIVNLTNTQYVYNKDPHAYSDALPIKKLTWDEYMQLVPKEWSPGAHFPFDPVAAKSAKDNHKKVIITDGTNLANLDTLLNGQEPDGTVIS